MNVCVVYNPKSGKKRLLAKLHDALESHGLIAKFVPVKIANQIPGIAAEYGTKTIIAAGGDGTVHAVVNNIMNTDLELGVIPIGTFNHFAKDLEISTRVDEAVAVIKKRNITSIDIGEVNGRAFINNSSLGLYTLIAQTTQTVPLLPGKWLGRLLGVVRILTSLPTYNISLVMHAKNIRCRTPFVFIGNNSYEISRFGFSNRKSLDRNILSVYVVKTCKRRKIIGLLFKAYLGTAQSEKYFDEYQTRELIIQTSHKRVRLAMDGEIRKIETPLHYKSKAKALKVIVP